MLFSLLFLGTILLWVIKSIQIIGPKEMAILIRFGKPICFLDSGPNFVSYLIYSLKKFSKKTFNFDYSAKEVVTKAGKYKGVKYGVQVIIVDSVAYINLPRDKNLIKILESGIPIGDKEAFKAWTEDVVVAAIRFVLGQKTWAECKGKTDKLEEEVKKVLRKPDGVLLKTGFGKDDISLVIKEVKLSKELEESLIAPDRERLKKDAAWFIAEAQAMKWVGMVFHTMALAEGKTIKEIQEKIGLDKNLQEKFVDYALKMNSDIEMADRKAIFKFINEGKDGAGVPGNIVLLATLLGRIFGEKDEFEDKKRKEVKEEIKGEPERIPSDREKKVMKRAVEILGRMGGKRKKRKKRKRTK
ncbi:SPFH domain-containing protein [Candidatus Babeliales bacterium]|nr:SPFH domain-containing protein [Candidatus Babeliales bacterium]